VHDYERLRLDALAGISETAHGLRDDQWDAASSCGGWRVHDVTA
jgi:Mycothiol maleylpyruvate isomerase N-terminal domain